MAYGSLQGQQTPQYTPPAPTPISSVTVTLNASSWTGSAAPYSITVTVNGVTANSYQTIKPTTTVTATQLEALQKANIQDGGQAANSITLKAFGEKPTINLPVEVILWGEYQGG